MQPDNISTMDIKGVALAALLAGVGEFYFFMYLCVCLFVYLFIYLYVVKHVP